jgi:pyrimidine deaminase RibD-like protein
MLIRVKRPQGSLYPQITQAPTNYFDFLNYFRGGHTIDNNLVAGVIANSTQANLLKSAIDSGHLTLSKNIANPDESVADIFLTDEGAEQLITPQDRQHCKLAVELARKSIHESDGEPHPYVGAVVVKDGVVIATGYRGETGEGRHGEYCALRKLNDDVDNVDLRDCTVYTTLEPCSIRKSGKTPCTTRLIKSKVARVVYGLADKDETVFGHSSLEEAGIEVDLFPKTLRQDLLILNKKWSDTRRQPEVMPPPNDTPPKATQSYNKPGTPMTDNIHLFFRPPKETGGFYTIEDIGRNVLACSRTFEEAAVKWHQIDTQKVLIEKLNRQGGLCGDQRLRLG